MAADKAARITGFANTNDGLLITCINGKSTADYFGGYDNGFRYPHDALLSPGRQYIKLMYVNGPNFAYKKIWLEAEPGVTYSAKSKVERYTISISVYDASLNAVGGPIDDAHRLTQPDLSC